MKKKVKRKREIKKRRKIFTTHIFFIGILCYMVYKAVCGVSSAAIKTDDIKYGEIKNTIKKEVVIIRDEHIIKAEIPGYVNYFLNEGERIKKYGRLAQLQDNNYNIGYGDKLKLVEQRIDELKSLGGKTPTQSDINTLETRIALIQGQIQNKIMNEDRVGLLELKETLMKLMEERSLLKGEGSLYGMDIAALEKEKAKLEKSLGASGKNIYSPYPGIVTYNVDGYEDILTPKNLLNLKFSELKKIESKEHSSKKEQLSVDQPIGKIVDNHRWFFATEIKREDILRIERGKRLEVIYKDVSFPAYLQEYYKGEDGVFIGVFRVDDDKIDFYSNRKMELEVVYTDVSGIKIPKKAVKSIKGKRGAFVISETGNADFKELKEILGEDSESIILNYKLIKRNSIDTVDLYDEVIMEPDKIKNGQKIR